MMEVLYYVASHPIQIQSGLRIIVIDLKGLSIRSKILSKKSDEKSEAGTFDEKT